MASAAETIPLQISRVMHQDDEFRLGAHSPRSGVVVVEVAGALDAVSAPLLGEALTDQLTSAHGRVVVDLGSVDFLGSSGLSVLAEASFRVRSEDPAAKLALVVSGNPVLHVLQITGLVAMFDVHPTVAEAIG